MKFIAFFLLNIFESVLLKIFIPENYTDDLVAIVLIFVNSIALALFIVMNKTKIKKDYNNVNILILISFAIRIAFLFWDRYCRDIFIFPNSGLDTGTFDSLAREYMLGINFSGFEYAKVLGVIYKLFYPNVLIGQYMNVIASIFTIFIVKKILNLLDIQGRYKKIAIYLICFLPNYLIMSSILLRESFITLFLTLTLYTFLLWWKTNKYKYMLYAAFSSFVAIYLHTGTIAYLISLFIISILINDKRKIKITPKKSMLVIVFSIVFLFVYSNNSSFFGYLSEGTSVKNISNKASLMNSGGSGYSIEIVPDDTILGMLINSPFRIFFFLASPLPWQWRGLNDIIAFFFSSLFYSFTIYKAIKKMQLSNKNKDLIICFLIFALSSAFIYSWGVSNAGTALRHRDKFLINFIILYILSKDSSNSYLNKKVFVKNSREEGVY